MLLLVVVGALGIAVGHPLDTVKVALHFETNKYELMHKLFLIFYFTSLLTFVGTSPSPVCV